MAVVDLRVVRCVFLRQEVKLVLDDILEQGARSGYHLARSQSTQHWAARGPFH